MELQRSLFSFYRVFVRKTPLVVWIVFAFVFLMIIGWEVGQIYAAKPVYNFEKVTRTAQNKTAPQPSQKNQIKSNNTSISTQQTQQKQRKKPFFLQPSYYSILNETSTIKVYLSQMIEYQQNEPNCQIVLNTQKLRGKVDQQNKKNPEADEEVQKQVKILQQVQIQKETQSKDDSVKQSQKNSKAQQQISSIIKMPDNIRNFDQITEQQHQFLLNQHSFMHITGNQHVIYLDQDNQFEQRHNIQVHAIILSKPKFSEYPDTFFGISSKLWRLHGNENITLNGNMLRSFGETFLNVGLKVKEMYQRSLNSVNLLISLKQFMNNAKDSEDTSEPTKEVQENAGNLVQEVQRPEKTNKASQTIQKESAIFIQPNQTNSSKINTTQIIKFLPDALIPLQLIYPLGQLKIYFHYPQTLRIEDVSRLVGIVESSGGIIYKTITFLTIYGQLFILSVIVGLLVRYLFFMIVTIYLFFGGCFLTKEWGWVHKYYMLIRNRFTQGNLFSSIKMMVLFVFALTGSMAIFTFGTKFILQNLFIYVIPFSQMYYAEMLLKNYFIVEMFYFVFCRTRTALRYFPLFSLALSVIILFLNEKLYCYHISWLMNLHLIVHFLLMVVFLGIENYIGSSEFYSEFIPSEDKPRALYYVGYDISWENTLPPIWTYFTTSFDLKYFGERQQVLIKRDYQMLYGRLLGMNQRQQLPEEEQDSEDNSVDRLNQNLSESNQMGLIR